MSRDLQTRIDSIVRKGELLSEQVRLTRERHSRALELITALRQELTECQERVERLETTLTRLSLTGPLVEGADRPTYESARMFLSGLVCEIDKCIAELND